MRGPSTFETRHPVAPIATSVQASGSAARWTLRLALVALTLLAALALSAPPAAAACQTPGPDTYGYTCTQTTDDFIDISSTGTAISLSDDEVSSAISLTSYNSISYPTFQYYGQSYSTISVSSNGFLTFGGPQNHGCCAGQVLPNSANPNNVVAGYWGDLHPGLGGTIKYQVITSPSTQFVVQFTGVPHYASSPPYEYTTFQIRLLYATNEIRVAFGPTSPGVANLVTGIENPAGTVGLRYKYGLYTGIGDGVANAGDGVYLNLDSIVGDDVEANDLRIIAMPGFTAGTQVGGAQADFGLHYTGMSSRLCYVDANGDTVVSLGEYMYLTNERATCAGSTQIGDMRLVATSGGGASTFVSGASSDFGLTLATPPAEALKYLDWNGNAAWDAGDGAYLKVSSSTSTVVQVGDLRLTASGGNAAFSRVTAASTDFNMALLNFPGSPNIGSPNVVVFYDSQGAGDGVINSGDGIFLNIDAVATDQVDVGDARILAISGSGTTSGQRVASGAADVGKQLVTSASSRVCYVNAGDAGSWVDDYYYLVNNRASCSGNVLAGDIRITAAAGKGPATFVMGSDSDAGLALLAPAADRLKYYDANANALWDAGDTLYLKLTSAVSTATQAGDLRLTLYGAYASFTRVMASDSDFNVPVLNLAGSPNVSTANVFAYHDSQGYIAKFVPPAVHAASAPQAFTAVRGATAGQITLNWQTPADNGMVPITGYRIYRGWASDNTTFYQDLGDVLTFTDTGLGNAQTRYYKVIALTSFGAAFASPVQSARTMNIHEPRILFENFEDSTFNASTATSGLWRITTECEAAMSGTTYLVFNRPIFCLYNLATRQHGQQAFEVDLTGTNRATLYFDHRWETESSASYDQKRVGVSTNGGSSWTNLTTFGSGNQVAWIPGSIDLSAYAGQVIRIRFYFDTIDGAGNSYEGWLIDNVEVTAGNNPTVTLGVAPSALSEAPQAATVTATLSAATDKTVTVNLAYSGNATNPADYTRSGSSIVIAPGATTGTVTVTSVQDTTDEWTESIIVDITTVTNGVESGTQQVTATITDDDAAPTVSISPSLMSIVENGQSQAVTATLSAASAKTVTVNLAYGGTATQGVDYTTTGSSITINPGLTTGTVTVTAVQDTLDEADETILVDITTVVNGAENGVQQANVTITDDDAAPTVTLTPTSPGIGENNVGQTITATLSAASGQTVTVNLAFAGTATLTSDYTRTGTAITINAGATTGSITVTSVQDTLDEPTETVIIDISSVTNGLESGTQTSTVSISDDDAAPSVTLGLSGSPMLENGGQSTVTATLSAVSGQAVTVDLAFSGNATLTSDYTRSGTSITINAGSASGSITLTAVQDTMDEWDESIVVDISSVTNGVESGTQQVTATITDDDATPSVTLGPANAGIGENNVGQTITATLSAASGKTVTVNLAFSGTATLTSDYTRTGTAITINPGATTGTVTVTSVQDSLNEASETIIADISTVLNAVESGSQTAMVTISDDDAAPTVTLSPAAASIGENTVGQAVTATLSAVSGQTVTVNLGFTGTATLTSDYTRTGTSITITAGATTGSITVTSVQDTLDEPSETVIVDVASVTNGVESGTQTSTVTITDDDATPSVTLGLAGSPMAEGAGGATVTATLSAVSGQTVTVNLAFSGNATLTSDYTRSGTSITINAGAASGSITLTSVQDTMDEWDESIVVDISSVTNAIESGTQQATALIADDDAAPSVSLSITDATVDEAAGNTKVVAAVSAPTGKTVTVNLAFAGTATLNTDYTRTSASIVIQPENDQDWIDIDAIQDALAEADETIIVDITSVTNAAENGTQQVTGAIVDDDNGPSAPQDFTAEQGDAGSLDLSWSAPADPGTSPVANYVVHGGDAPGTLMELAILAGDDFDFTEGELGPGVTRYYKVAAMSAAGTGPFSPVQSATTIRLPNAPTGLVGQSGPAAGEITMTWTAPSDTDGQTVTHYKVFRGTEPSDVDPLTTIVAPVAPPYEFTDTGLPPGAVRYYAVAAITVAGEGPQSNVGHGSTFQPDPPPDMPEGRAYSSAVWQGHYAYVFGGKDEAGNNLNTIVRYDVEGNDVEVLPVTLPTGRHGTSAVWAPALPPGGLGNPDGPDGDVGGQSCHPACHPGLAYIIAGRGINDPPQSNLLIFDPANDEVEVAGATFPSARYGTSAVWDDEARRVYIFGGRGTTCEPACDVGKQIWEYDPAADTLTKLTVELPHEYSGTSAVWDPQAGVAYIFGGEHEHTPSGQSCHPACHRTILRYTPETDEVSVLPSELPSGRWNTSAAWSGSAAYIFGGQNESGPIGEIVRFDPATGDVSIVGHLPTDRTGTAAIYDGTQALVFGGDEGDDGDEALEEIVRFTPTAPRNAAATAGPGAGTITLAWQPPAEPGFSPVVLYRVYRGIGGPAETLVGEVPVGSTQYADTTLGNGVTAVYKVTAVSAVGEGPQSEEASATTFTQAAAPQGLSADFANLQQRVRLTWVASTSNGGTPITAYIVYKAGATGALVPHASVGPTTTVWDDFDCLIGDVCRYAVAALNLVGPSGQSNGVTAAGNRVPV